MWQLPENKNNLPFFALLFAFLYFMQLFQISSNIVSDQFKHRGQKQLPKQTAQEIEICSFYIELLLCDATLFMSSFRLNAL